MHHSVKVASHAVTYLVHRPIVCGHFPENSLSDWGSADIPWVLRKGEKQCIILVDKDYMTPNYSVFLWVNGIIYYTKHTQYLFFKLDKQRSKARSLYFKTDLLHSYFFLVYFIHFVNVYTQYTPPSV